jgi:hypothetical protein
MERRLEMVPPVQTNLNTSIGYTRLVTFTEHTVNTYIFPLFLPNRGKIHLLKNHEHHHVFMISHFQIMFKEKEVSSIILGYEIYISTCILF